MAFDLFTTCGLVGASCFIFSYFATLQGWLSPKGWRLPALNLMGAAMVLTSLTVAWNLPSAMLECFWGAISLYGLIRAIRRGSGA
jgi:hypothetical protein